MRHARIALLSISICAVVFALSGCGSSVMSNNHTQSGPPPAVSSVGLQANGSAANRWLYVQFNEDMDPATINSKTITVTDSSGAAVPGNVAWFANFDTAGFQPNPALQENSTYTLTVSTGVASEQGVPLAKAYTDSFTTRSTTDESPIYVKSVSPSPNATCVSVTPIITITFSEGADISTLTSANIVITVPGNKIFPEQMTYNVGTATLTVVPGAGIPRGVLPTGTITVTVQNVADAAGVAMTKPYSWSFSTACNGGGGGPTTQYMAPLFSESDLDTTMNGQVTIDTTGSTTVQLTGASAGATYTAQFCPAVDAGAYTAPNCFDVTTVSTDSSGNGSATVIFPKSGDWAGDFYVNDSAGKPAYQTFVAPNVNNETYMSTLLPDTTTNNGVVTTLSPQAPLTSGTVSYSNGSLKFTVSGASPNAKYDTNESETTYINSSGTYELATFTTDAMGNGSLSTELNNIGGDLFQVVAPNGAGYIGGFSVPQ